MPPPRASRKRIKISARSTAWLTVSIISPLDFRMETQPSPSKFPQRYSSSSWEGCPLGMAAVTGSWNTWPLTSKVSTLGHFSLFNKPSKRSLRLCHFFMPTVPREALEQVMIFHGHLHKTSLCVNFHAMAAKNLGWVLMRVATFGHHAICPPFRGKWVVWEMKHDERLLRWRITIASPFTLRNKKTYAFRTLLPPICQQQPSSPNTKNKLLTMQQPNKPTINATAINHMDIFPLTMTMYRG